LRRNHEKCCNPVHGSYAPTQVLRNSYFDKLLGENIGTWLETNLRIKGRRWCSEKESTADLCVESGRRALQNTGAACIPMALDDAAKNGKLKENDLIFLITSGGSLSFAAAAFRY